MNYARNLWYVGGWSHDLATDQPFAMRILGEPIVMWRNASNRLTALEDRCVHRLAPLSLGRCEGEHIRCMYHGLLYDRSGAVREIPGQDLIPPQARVRSYPLVEKHSWLWVWMGDPAAADESLIPGAVGLDDADYILGHGHLDYAAEARLINDNLLDFSHLSYVHAKSFGAGEDWARERPRVTPLADGVRVERWIARQPGMPGMPDHSVEQVVDRYSRYDFLLPGILLMTGGSFPAGTAQRLANAPPTIDDAIGGVTFTSQAVTPLSDKTSRYFFSWGPHRRHGDAALRDTLMEIAGRAFAEDRVIIEAQQRIIDVTSNPRIMPTSADRAVTLFNQMVAKRIREERELPAAMNSDTGSVLRAAPQS
jgi:phenylpropionate dioxygenase-like ring-hydroxylating dioxygenase large terminal subunit